MVDRKSELKDFLELGQKIEDLVYLVSNLVLCSDMVIGTAGMILPRDL